MHPGVSQHIYNKDPICANLQPINMELTRENLDAVSHILLVALLIRIILNERRNRK